MAKVVVIVSGGMDSATLLYDVVKQGHEVYALSFDYGQRHRRELDCANKLCERTNVPHKILNLSILNEIASSSQTRKDIAVPHGRYDEENMKLTVVPNRNMVMLSLAIAYAIGIKATRVYYGAHSGDHAIYPDCRRDFVYNMNQAAMTCDWHHVEALAPYLGMDKGDIAIRGKELHVPYELTWSCYEGKEVPCGKCGACTERAEAFAKAGIPDPLIKVSP